MRQRLAVALTLALAIAALPVLGAEPDPARIQIQPYDPPKPAPPFALPDLNGNTVQLEALKGKVVLVFFWTTW